MIDDKWRDGVARLRSPGSFPGIERDAGWAVGPLGVALLWAHVPKRLGFPADRLRDEWLEWTVAQRPLPLGSGWIHGTAAGAVALATIADRSTLAASLLPRFLAATRGRLEATRYDADHAFIGNYDLTTGAAGDVLCLRTLVRLGALSARAPWYRAELERALDFLAALARRDVPFSLSAECAAKDPLCEAYGASRISSLAHGIAGPYLAVKGLRLAAARVVRTRLAPLVRAYALSAGTRFGWCNSALSVRQYVGSRTPVELDPSALAPSEPLSLCHGSAGTALLALNDGQTSRAAVARYFDACRRAVAAPREDTLLTGTTGVLLLRLAFESPSALRLLRTLFFLR